MKRGVMEMEVSRTGVAEEADVIQQPPARMHHIHM